ncbi:MAG: sensor histidine kinase [Flavobacteriales bacterium]
MIRMPFSSKLISLLLFIAGCGMVNAQNTCGCTSKTAIFQHFDSLRAAQTFDEVKIYGESLLSSKEVGCRSLGHEFLTFYFHKKKEWALANSQLDSQKRMLQEEGCASDSYMGNHYLRAVGYFNNSSFDSAFVHFMACLEIAEKIQDQDYQIKSLTSLGAVLNHLQNAQKSAHYLKKASILASQKGDTKLQAQINANLASNYHSLYNDTEDLSFSDSSKYYANLCMQSARQIGNSNLINRCYNFLGHYALLHNDPDGALNYTDSVLSTKSTQVDNHALCFAYELRSMALGNLGKYEAALQDADSCYRYALLSETITTRMNALRQISSNGKKLGLFERALAAVEELHVIEDSVSNAETKDRIEELEQQYNKAQNEKKILALSQETEIKSLNIKLLIAGIIISLVILAIIIIAFRQRDLKNKQHINEAEQRLNRARMNPHFFFNTLASLQTFALQSNDSKKTSHYLAKYARIMRQTLESTYEELHTLEEEKDYLDHYLELQQLRQPGKFGYSVKFENIEDAGEFLLPSMLLQPFLENSIEHGFRNTTIGGQIDILFRASGDHLIIEINDNGQVSATEETTAHISRASQIIRDRLTLLNKTYRKNTGFESVPDPKQGYKVKITLPLISQK